MQLAGEVLQRNDGHIAGERVTLLAGIDKEALDRSQNLAGIVEALLQLRRQAALDLDRPYCSTGQCQNEIDLSAGRCAEKLLVVP